MKKQKKMCSVKGCERTVDVKSRGLCNRHYIQMQRHGKILPKEKEHNQNSSDVCSVEDCNRSPTSKGLCKTHYSQARRSGKLRTGNTCSVEGCTANVEGKGYCNKHYLQMQRHGRIIDDEMKEEKRCSVDGCDRKHFGKGYCLKHYKQVRKHGKLVGDRIIREFCTVPDCDNKHFSKGYCKKHHAQFKKYGYTLAENENVIKVICPCCTKKIAITAISAHLSMGHKINFAHDLRTNPKIWENLIEECPWYNYTLLHRLMVIEEMSRREVGEYLGCSARKIKKAARLFGLGSNHIKEDHKKKSSFYNKDKKYIRELFDDKCFNCGMTEEEHKHEWKQRLHIDHPIALINGGLLSRYHACLLCLRCDSSKGTKHPIDFYSPEKYLSLWGMLRCES